jgi:hypothetical protein
MTLLESSTGSECFSRVFWTSIREIALKVCVGATKCSGVAPVAMLV